MRIPRPDFGTVLAASLTLLGLIIGFSFSMATGRYDLRKTMKRRRRMRSGRSMCGRICCRRRGFAGAGSVEGVHGPADTVLSRRGAGMICDQIDRIRSRCRTSFGLRIRVGECATDAGRCTGGGGDERRAELAGVYAGGVVEPDSGGGVVSDVWDCAVLQCAAGVWGAEDCDRGCLWCCRWWWRLRFF